jgi:uncharacterized membrane protein YtjA (UPF0391 family)
MEQDLTPVVGYSEIRFANAELIEVNPMLYWAVVFLVVALVAGVFGFAGIAGTAAWIAQTLFVLFLILFVVSLIFGRRRPIL